MQLMILQLVIESLPEELYRMNHTGRTALPSDQVSQRANSNQKSTKLLTRKPNASKRIIDESMQLTIT
jgi:hypothetical protein